MSLEAICGALQPDAELSDRAIFDAHPLATVRRAQLSAFWNAPKTCHEFALLAAIERGWRELVELQEIEFSIRAGLEDIAAGRVREITCAADLLRSV